MRQRNKGTCLQEITTRPGIFYSPLSFPYLAYVHMPNDFITLCVNILVSRLADLQKLLQNKCPVHVLCDLCQWQAKVQKDSFALCPRAQILEIRINGANKTQSLLVGQALLGSGRKSWFLGNQSQLKCKQYLWGKVYLSKSWYPWILWCVCMLFVLRIMNIC